MRWIRHIFTVITIGCGVLWVASFFLLISCVISIGTSGVDVFTTSALGRTSVFITHKSPPQAQSNWHIGVYRFPGSDMRKEYWVTKLRSPRNGSSFEYITATVGYSTSTRVRFPLWLPTLLFGTWPSIALTRQIKRRYFSPGICRKCGYDLRGTPSGVCPECGRASAKQKTPTEAEV